MFKSLLLAAAIISKAVLSTPTVYEVGPYGFAPGDSDFDDRAIPAVNQAESVVLFCRSGQRLDYIHMVYRDPLGQTIAYVNHGDPEGGAIDPGRYAVGRKEGLYSITVAVCDKGKHHGKICGIRFRKHDDLVNGFICGNMIGLIQPEYIFGEHQSKFFALRGSTANGGKVITKIGWTEEKLPPPPDIPTSD